MFVAETERIAEAEAALRQSFPGVRIAPSDSGAPFRLRHTRIEHGALTFTRLSIAGTIRTLGEYPHPVTIGRRRNGRVDIGYGGVSIDTYRPYLRPRGVSSADFVDATVELIILDPDEFSMIAAQHLAGTGHTLLPVVPTSAASRSPHGGALWNSTANLIASHLEADSRPTREAELVDLAVAAVLAAFPVTAERTTAGSTRALPGAVRRATDYIHAHLADPVTIPMIASAARLSVRALQVNFRQHLGTTPHHYLRAQRLEAARAELLRSEPGETTVEACARRWGLSHPSHFAAAYRAAYGETPQTTLRN